MKALTRLSLLMALGLLLPLAPAAAQTDRIAEARGAGDPTLRPISLFANGELIRELNGHRTVFGLEVGELWTEPLVTRNRRFNDDRDWLLEPYRLAVFLIEFPDRKRDRRYADPEFVDRMLFSRQEYTEHPTGSRAYGSMNDFWIEQSYGQFRLEGTVYDWVEVDHPHSYFAEGSRNAERRERLIVAAVDKVKEREENENLLDGYDGIGIIFAGNGPRRTILWPHRSSVRIDGRSWNYYIKSEGDRVGVHVHEFGHMLDQRDKYGSSGSGLGMWCTMANGHGRPEALRNARPLHVCVWCKIKCGWVQPTVVDPRVPQRIVMRPIEEYQHEAIMIPVNESGEEFYLLENRQQIGFNSGVYPGLLIWHIGEDGRREINNISTEDIELIPAHGREKRGNRNPIQEDLENVPWPREGKTEFTPDSSPSSKTKGEDDFPIYLRNIRQENGLIYFDLGPPAAEETPGS